MSQTETMVVLPSCTINIGGKWHEAGDKVDVPVGYKNRNLRPVFAYEAPFTIDDARAEFLVEILEADLLTKTGAEKLKKVYASYLVEDAQE